MIARISSLVILNSISMANSSPDSIPYRPSNSRCTTVRYVRSCSICSLLRRSVHGGMWLEVERTVYAGTATVSTELPPGDSGSTVMRRTYLTPVLLRLISSGTERASGLVTRSSPIWVLT